MSLCYHSLAQDGVEMELLRDRDKLSSLWSQMPLHYHSQAQEDAEMELSRDRDQLLFLLITFENLK